MDLIETLMLDHARIASMLDHVLEVTDGQRSRALYSLVSELVRHETAEEQVVYPALVSCVAGGGAIAAERLKEQHATEDALAEIEGLQRTEDAVGGPIDRLSKAVTEHAHAEEATVFWLLRTNLSDEERRRLARRYARAKDRAPTHPHPRVPHGRVRALLIGPLARRLDRRRDERQGRGARPGDAPWEPPVDAISVLSADHDAIRLLLDQVERQGEGAPRPVFDRLVAEVSRHGAAELEQLYPRVAQLGEEAQDLVKRARLDHEEVALGFEHVRAVKLNIAEFREATQSLAQVLREHLEVEEREMFPLLTASATPEELGRLGDKLRTARRRAPKAPHPHAPKSALGSRITGRVLRAVERMERGAVRR